MNYIFDYLLKRYDEDPETQNKILGKIFLHSLLYKTISNATRMRSRLLLMNSIMKKGNLLYFSRLP